MKPGRKLLIIGCFFFCLYAAYPLQAQTTLAPTGNGLSLEPLSAVKSRSEPIVLQPITVTSRPVDQDDAQQGTAVLPGTQERPAAHPAGQPIARTDSRLVFKKFYNTAKIDEQEEIRAEWTKTFGCDVWYPYYLAKEVEHRVSEKASIKIFKMKGKPEFKKGSFLYVFRTKF